MLIFKKELVLKRLEKENLLDKISEDSLKYFEKLDGKKVYRNKNFVNTELEYVVKDKNGVAYPVNRNDLEEVDHIPRKKEKERCR